MRLIHPHITPSAEAVGITFDCRPLSALPGETVAAALSAAGILAYRHTASGAPRGLWCGMGACFDCLVTIDGRANQRACLAKVAPGMVVESAPPAAPAPLAPEPASQAAEIAPDVLVVGAGPAGLSAAIAAAEAGCSVVLLDERDAAGGQYLKPLAASHAHAAPDRQFRQAAALRARAEAAGVVFQHGATVWGAFAPDELGVLVGGRNMVARPRRLVLAPGAHERPVPIPGWTLPGVMTTGALQTLARANRVSPGRRVVVAGNGPLNLQLACELVEGGVEVAAVLEAAPKPGFRAWREAVTLAARAPDLAWDGVRYLAVLRRAGVKVIWGAMPERVEPATDGLTLHAEAPGGPRAVTAQAVALNLGFQPETGLARALGCAHRFTDSGLGRLETITGPDGRTSLAQVLAIGDGAQIGGARIALARGRLAGLAAARDLGRAVPDDAASRTALARAEAFQAALWRLFEVPGFDASRLADDTVVCRCEEVSAGALRAAMAQGACSLGSLKKATRAGMGRCQGRMCAATVARIAGAGTEPDWAAPRAPVKPIPALALAMEKPEWTEAPSFEAVSLPRDAGEGRGGGRARSETACDLLVIGAGVLGLAIARAAAREGLHVVALDRGEPGQGASTANAGSLHVQLHAYDSAGAAEGPESAAAQILTLGPRSVALWRDIARESGEALAIRTEGGLMLAETEAQLRALADKVAMERDFGVISSLLGANELYAAAPWLAPGFAGAAFCAEEGQMDPLRGLSALLRLAREAGAEIRGATPVTALSREGSVFRAETPEGVIRAARVVNAAGPWAGQIAARLGAPIPVRATVQQVIATEAAGAELLRPLVLHGSRHLSLKQGDAGHLILGGAWPGELDAAGRPRNLRASIEGNLWVARSVLPAIEGLHVIRAWTGLNVLIPGPILGADQRVPGLFHAVTFNGWTLAPVIAELIAEALRGGKGPPAVFSPSAYESRS
ncbi:FAD-dependent oxidoreductase [Falsiroseomonas bella]|uniref:FAD-dependent oxidoreductase n=1 Tax=Falsiroseomonas bella TaxID=2184016 RepID=A0A317FEP6_9PROT|nr:FAD-dependent oxidoreductase [Falsiroseomonas bella]PWS36477.1 FAD-dependent oxidoreductase [Falsiroseomonas bella]